MTKFNTVTTALVCHAFLAWPTLVHGQIEAPHEAAQIQIGPVSLYPSLQIAEAGRDQNVYNDPVNPKEDYTFTAVSRALAVVKLGENELMFSTGNDYVWFKQFAAERSSNTRYAARANLSASKFKPFVGAEWQHTSARPNPEIDARARRLERSGLAGFNLNLADRMALTASVRIDDSTYEKGEVFRGADLAYSLNRAGRSVSAGVRYALTPLTLLMIAGDYSEDTFPDSHIRDSKSYSVVPTLEFSPDASIRGRLSVGVEKFLPLDPALPPSIGPVYAASLNWSLFGKTTFDVAGNRDTRYSYQDAEPYYLLTGGRVNIVQHLFGPVDLLGGADWEHMAYRWHRSVDAEDASAPNQLLKILSGGVAVTIGHGFRIAVSAESTERRSTQDPTRNYRRNRLMSSVTIGS